MSWCTDPKYHWGIDLDFLEKMFKCMIGVPYKSLQNDGTYHEMSYFAWWRIVARSWRNSLTVYQEEYNQVMALIDKYESLEQKQNKENDDTRAKED